MWNFLLQINIGFTSEKPNSIPIVSSSKSCNCSEKVLIPPTVQLPVFDYNTFTNNPPEMVIVESTIEANEQLSRLSGHFLGFDIEYANYASDPEDSNQHRRPALLQFCDEKLIVLVQIDVENEGSIPTKAIEILCNKSIYKIGANVRGDIISLINNYPKEFRLAPVIYHNSDIWKNPTYSEKNSKTPSYIPSSLLEISRMACAVEAASESIYYSREISLEKLCSYYLGKRLIKGTKSRPGSWTDTLTEAQIDYAANDAYATLQIFLELQKVALNKRVPQRYNKWCTKIAPFIEKHYSRIPDCELYIHLPLQAGFSSVIFNRINFMWRKTPIGFVNWKRAGQIQWNLCYKEVGKAEHLSYEEAVDKVDQTSCEEEEEVNRTEQISCEKEIGELEHISGDGDFEKVEHILHEEEVVRAEQILCEKDEVEVDEISCDEDVAKVKKYIVS